MKTCSLLFLLRNNDTEILLAMKKRGFGSGRYNGVGGKVEPGETIEQATVRECQEEVGVTPHGLQKVAVHDFIFPPEIEDIKVHAYVSRLWGGEPVETDEMAPQWFKVSDIPYAEMWDDDIVWMPLVLQGKKLETRFTFDSNERMVGAEVHQVAEL